jgi:putative endonuclease
MGLAAFIAARFSPSLNCRCRLTAANGSVIPPGEVGRLGEKIAKAWLRSQGAKILYRNFKAPRGGEVDIVAREGKLLVFAEVKTRRAGGLGRPLDAVDRGKQRLIERGANEWLRLLGTREVPWRFDVIEVILTDGEKPLVHRVEDAF